MSLWTKVRNTFTKPLKKVLDWLIPSQEQPGILIEKSGTDNPYPVAYGLTTAPAIKIFKITSNKSGGAKNEYLHLICVFCEGEVDEIEEIFFNDVASAEIDSERYYIEKFNGSDTQSYCATLGNEVGNWQSTAQLNGLCYAYVRLKLNKDLDWWQGEPTVKARIRGRKIKDIRTGVVGYSANPALVLWDIFTNPRFGKGEDESKLDIESFKVAADFCDETESFTKNSYEYEYDPESGQMIAIPTDTTVTSAPRMTCNYLMDTNNKLLDNIKEIRSGCRGILIPSSDGIKFQIERGGLPVFTFDKSNLRNEKISSAAGSKNSYHNRVTVRYPSAQILGQYDEVTWPKLGDTILTDWLVEDKNVPLNGSYDFPTINNAAEAWQMAEVVCRRSRYQRQIKLPGQPWTVGVEPGDIVAVNNDTHGYINKAFMILEKHDKLDGNIDFDAIEHQDSIFVWSVSEVNEYYPNTSLALAGNLPIPTGLTYTETPDDGFVQGTFTWVDANDFLITDYRLQIFSGTSLVLAFEVNTNSKDITTLALGEYTAKLSSKNSLYESETRNLNFSVTVEPSQPGEVLSLYATSHAFLENADNAITPASITITAQTNSQETPVWTTSPPGIALTGNDFVKTLTKAAFAANDLVTITAACGALTDKISVVRIKDGSPAFSAHLTNDTHAVSCNEDGTPKAGAIALATGSFIVYRGGIDVSAQCSFSVKPASAVGLTGPTINTSGVYSIASITENSALVVFLASYTDGNNVTTVFERNFTLIKNIDGVSGARGAGHYYVTTTATSWTAAVESAARAACPSGAIISDVVTVSNESASPVFVETRIFNGTSFVTQGVVIDGNLVVNAEAIIRKLSALNANVGTLTGGEIIGAKIATALTGQRAELNSQGSPIAVYDNNNNLLFGTQVNDSALELYFKGRFANNVVNDALFLNSNGVQSMRDRLGLKSPTNTTGGTIEYSGSKAYLHGTFEINDDNILSGGSTLTAALEGNANYRKVTFSSPSAAKIRYTVQFYYATSANSTTWNSWVPVGALQTYEQDPTVTFIDTGDEQGFPNRWEVKGAINISASQSIGTTAGLYYKVRAIVTRTSGDALLDSADNSALSSFIGDEALSGAIEAHTHDFNTEITNRPTVGDGGLTEKNFSAALKTKLENLPQTAFDYTGTLSGAAVFSAINVINGLVTSVTSRNLTLANLGYSGASNANYITNNNQLTNGAGYVTSSGNTIIGTDVDINTSGATIIDNLYMTDGVITSHGTRTLTLADLGYSGASNANYITNNNQLSNGAGYVTSSGNTIIGTDADINTSGATIIDNLYMTDGVITSHGTRNLSYGDIGALGAGQTAVNAAKANAVVQNTNPAAGTYRILLGNGNSAAASVYNYSQFYWNQSSRTIMGSGDVNISGSAGKVGGFTHSAFGKLASNQTWVGTQTYSKDSYFIQNGRTTRMGSRNTNWFHFETNAPDGFYFYNKIQSAGTLLGTDAGGTSDMRLKHKDRVIGQASAKRMAMEGIVFEWNDVDINMPQGEFASLRAQQVQKVFKHGVIECQNDNLDTPQLNISYSAMIGLLVESANEDRKLIDKQQAQINALDHKLKALIKVVEALLT